MPSVLFLNRVYPPDEGATGQLLADFAQTLAVKGWGVTVVAAGNGESQSSNCECQKDMDPHIERIAGLPFTRSSHWKRTLSYLTIYLAFV